MKILIADALSAAAEKVFADRDLGVDVKVGLSEDELISIINAYDGLAVRSATTVTPAVIAAAKKLKVIGRAGIGVDTIDVPAATKAGIVVMNTPHGNAITTAEHTVAMMMALMRHIPQANASTQAGKWEKKAFTGTELFGKTLGIIGCGTIGALVAERALGLKMKVIAHDPFLSEDRARALGVEAADLQALFKRADIVTLHTPMTDNTRGLINAKAFAQMKPGVRLLNVARGGLIVEADLKAALDSGQVAGAALDVFEHEPATENALFHNPNVICTPHLGASTHEAQETVAVQIAEQISDFLLSGAVSNAVNMPSMTAEEAPRLQPYIALATQLGQMAGQMTQGATRLTITYAGAATQLNINPLTASLLAAFLKGTHASVNMVNARTIAEQSGLAITEAKQESIRTYQTLLQVEVTDKDNTTLQLAGTLYDTGPRLVRIDSIALEAVLAGPMILSRNRDLPGFIGHLGKTLGDAGVNIASFTLGRDAPEGEAIALVAIDQKIDQSTFTKVREAPHCITAHQLFFS